MSSLLLQAQSGPAGPPRFVEVDLASLSEVPDPWRRSQLAMEHVRRLESQVNALLAIRRDAVGELVNQHRTPLSRVASHLGLTKGRIGQLAQAARRALERGEDR